jgi:hypothetical protein
MKVHSDAPGARFALAIMTLLAFLARPLVSPGSSK